MKKICTTTCSLTLTAAANPGWETSGKDESWFSCCFKEWQVDSCRNRCICVGCRDVRTSLPVWGWLHNVYCVNTCTFSMVDIKWDMTSLTKLFYIVHPRLDVLLQMARATGTVCLHDMIHQDFTSTCLTRRVDGRNCLIYQCHIPVCNEIKTKNHKFHSFCNTLFVMWEPLWLGTKLNYSGDVFTPSDDEASVQWARGRPTDGADWQAVYTER